MNRIVPICQWNVQLERIYPIVKIGVINHVAGCAMPLQRSDMSAPQKLDDDSLAKAVRLLCRRQPLFKAVVKAHGMPSLRATSCGLAALLQMVTEQFLSLAAAAAIWKRLQLRLSTCDPQTILTCPLAELVSLGLSRAKAKSFHGLAEAVQTGVLDFAALEQLDDAIAHKVLVALPGIGPWTADIYLLSVLLRSDAWPWGDVALQVAAQNLFRLEHRPDKTEMLALGEAFRPWRAVAARLLWSHYRGMKQMSQA
jgi:DNA-3-methyladenine glycosylase II